MNVPARKLFSIFILLVPLFTGVHPLSARAGIAPSLRSAHSTTPSISFGWAKPLGGAMFDVGNAIAVDDGGNVYTAGYFNGVVDFDPEPGVYNLISAGFSDVFVSKLDSAGKFLWAKSMGGTGYDFGLAMKVDASGNVFTAGYFNGTVDFDPGESVYELTSAGWTDVFVSKLDSGGNFVWAKSLGGSSDDLGTAITVDTNGNVITTGYFRETGDFDPGAGTHNLTSAGEYDIFLCKLDSDGNLVWAESLGGASNDYARAIASNANGDVYTVGYYFNTADFDPGPEIFNLDSAGSSDIFVSKLDSSGSFLWAKGLGGSSDDVGNGVTVDIDGNVYMTGSFLSTADFDPGESAYELSSRGGADIFVGKLANGGDFVWAKSMGGKSNEFGYAITSDTSGKVYTTGYFLSTADFDPGESINELSSTGEADIFISKLDQGGNFVWAHHMGGMSDDYGNAIAVGASGNVYTTGSFIGISDFDPGAGTFDLTSAGEEDIFISKLLNPVTATLRSTSAQDGWILESSETSDKGGAVNSTASSLYLGDNAQKKQYRSVLSFNTKILPDNAIINKVILKVKKQGIAGGGNPVNFLQGFMLDVKGGFFGSVPALQAGDFQAKPSKSYGPFKPVLTNSWYTFNLTPAKSAINKLATNGGVTQLRLRFQLDDNNNSKANHLKLFSGNASAASRPQLIIEYYLP